MYSPCRCLNLCSPVGTCNACLSLVLTTLTGETSQSLCAYCALLIGNCTYRCHIACCDNCLSFHCKNTINEFLWTHSDEMMAEVGSENGKVIKTLWKAIESDKLDHSLLHLLVTMIVKYMASNTKPHDDGSISKRVCLLSRCIRSLHPPPPSAPPSAPSIRSLHPSSPSIHPLHPLLTSIFSKPPSNTSSTYLATLTASSTCSRCSCVPLQWSMLWFQTCPELVYSLFITDVSLRLLSGPITHSQAP